MVIGLQLAFTDFFPEDSAAKSRSKDAETIDGLTFGGILQSKEKQLQDIQTVGVSSVAAAVAATQSLPVLKPDLEINLSMLPVNGQAAGMETGDNAYGAAPEVPTRQPVQTNPVASSMNLPQATKQAVFDAEVPIPVTETDENAVDVIEKAGMQVNASSQPGEISPFNLDAAANNSRAQSAGKVNGKFAKRQNKVDFREIGEDFPEEVADDSQMVEAQIDPPAVAIPLQAMVDVPSTVSVSLDVRSGDNAESIQPQTTVSQTKLARDVFPDRANSQTGKSDAGIGREKTGVSESRSVFESPQAETIGVDTPNDAMRNPVKPEMQPAQAQTELPHLDSPETIRGQAGVTETSNANVKDGAVSFVPAVEGSQSKPETFETEASAAEPIARSTKKLDSASEQGTRAVGSTEKTTIESTPVAGEMRSMPVDIGDEKPVVKTNVVDAQHTADVSASETRQMMTQPSAGNEIIEPVALSSWNAVDARAREETVISMQAEAIHENVNSVEKRQESKPGVEAAVTQTPPAREKLVETLAGPKPGTDTKIQNTEIVQQIVHRVDARIHNRSTEMHLQLNPKELGTIDIQMVSSPQGVSVTLSAEQPATGRLLETQLNQLHQSLTDAGVQISNLNVGQHGQPRQEGGSLNQNQQFAPPSQRNSFIRETNSPETRHLTRGTGRPGEVDYLI